MKAKDQPLSRALPFTNPLDFHAEIQVRVNAALSSLDFGWALLPAATAQPCADSAAAGKATRGAVLARGLGPAGQGRGLPGGLQGRRSWGTHHSRLLWPVNVPRAPEKYLEILYPGACKVSWLPQSDFPGKGTS